MPYRAYTHYCNRRLMKVLEEGKLAEEIFRNKVSAVGTVGNFSLCLRVGEHLNQVKEVRCSTANSTER